METFENKVNKLFEYHTKIFKTEISQFKMFW